MTKKLIVIILSVILCLAVVGGCFALYHKDAEQLEITFGSEQAVTLTTTIGGTGELNFNGVKLSPAQDTATQEITLNVNTPNPETLAGLSGQLTVTLDGALKDAILLKASYVDGEDTKTLDATSYVISLTLPLDQLPEVLTLTATLIDTDDATFAQNSNKSATISVTWEAIDWAPEIGAYYIVGDMSGWAVNKNAIKMNAPVNPNAENPNLAEWTGVIAAGTQFKCVKYNGVDNLTWYDLAYEPNYGPAKVDKYGDLEGGVTESNGNLVAPASGEEIYVCINTENGSNYSWGQTVASKTESQA